MTEPETIVGFDGSACGDTSLVVLARSPGEPWRVESTDGPDAAAVAEHVTAWLATHLPGQQFKLDGWQRSLVELAYRGVTLNGPEVAAALSAPLLHDRP